MSTDKMIHLNNDPTGENFQQPPDPLTAGPAIDDELSGDLHGPGQTSRGPATVNIKGQVKGGRSLSKRGKKAIIFGGAGVAALIIGGVMMAGHHGGTASSPSVELAGASNAHGSRPGQSRRRWHPRFLPRSMVRLGHSIIQVPSTRRN
ncbi:hypothetical protein BBC27_12045 [Acidithiobacillus ferrivorans]|uniref:Uncharacterized protein n=1 Tax=Acidithiobacillus ferrivorans TaxID=160808 RepID=A0A1B9BY59_9PROT|nr:hypothetical protein [Acidithiobacillus ferrivorans]OCB02648.1 hypothetical protein BBC27_12045 [Acidithiobacillus ferrivorans]